MKFEDYEPLIMRCTVHVVLVWIHTPVDVHKHFCACAYTSLILCAYMLFCKFACALLCVCICFSDFVACTTVVYTCSFVGMHAHYCGVNKQTVKCSTVTVCRKVTKREFTLIVTIGYSSPQNIILGHLSFKR